MEFSEHGDSILRPECAGLLDALIRSLDFILSDPILIINRPGLWVRGR